MASLPPDRVGNAIATAELLVDHWSAEGMDAQAIGDRDLALGREALEALQKRAKYPFITTNLVDAGSGQPLFKRFEVIEVGQGAAALQVGIFALVSPRGAGPDATSRLRIEPPLEAMKTALAQAKAAGVDVVIVLSQLSARDESAIAEALPEVQLFLGGDGVGVTPDPEDRGKALAFQASQKGKHLGFLTLGFDDPAGAGAPFFDPSRRYTLERKKADAERRIEMYQKLLGEAAAATQPPEAAPAVPGPSPSAPQPPRRKAPTEMYERQLAAARAELQLAQDDLASLATDTGEVKRNTVAAELVPLGRDVVDAPDVKARVEAFRKTWPDPTPGH